MSRFEISKLPISGYAGNPVANLFFHPAEAGQASTLALVLPGMRYSADMPLLYYPTQLFLQHQADVLQVRADYTRPDYQAASAEGQAQRLSEDTRAAWEAGKAQGSYDKFVLLGKSIGTVALAHLISSGLGASATSIWLTPLLYRPQVVDAALRIQGPALFVAGRTDPAFDPQAMERICQATGARALLFDDANHSLEIPSGPLDSLKIMADILRAISDLLDG